MSKLRNRRGASDVTTVSTHETSPVALIGSGKRGVITSWNRAATVLLGWKAVDVMGRTLLDVLGCEDVAAANVGNGPTRVRSQVTAANGTALDVELFVDIDAFRYLTTGEYTVAVIPVAPSPDALDAGTSPRIDSWMDAAREIREVGSFVHCVAIGLFGVDAVNRGYSRSTGDAVLREVADRLKRAVGRGGRVVRLAGNQFVVVAPADDVLDIPALVALVSQPVETRLGTVRIGGYAGSTTGDSSSGLVVLGRAVGAMQRAEALGVGSIQCSMADEPKVGLSQPRLTSLLIDAVARREIAVSFQPVVELTSGRIVEFEALARWTSSELGVVAPSAFIQAAEEAGLIHELGQIVLGKTLDVVQAEVAAGRWGERRVSVNVSAMQLRHPELSARVIAALTDRGVSGELLQLELTGTRSLSEIEIAAMRLGDLRDVGVRLAIDAFGTGGANLAYLRDMPIGAVKIDGHFVANLNTSVADTAVIRSVVALARELRLDVVAERVETSEQHFALARLGCQAAQGFLYARDRCQEELYEPVNMPHRPDSLDVPYPDDEAGRLEALHLTDALDTASEDVYNEIVEAAAELDSGVTSSSR